MKVNLISSHVKISMTSYALSSLASLIVERTQIYFYMIETSSKIAGKYLAAFGNFWRFPETIRNVQYELRTVLREFLKIFATVRKLREIA